MKSSRINNNHKRRYSFKFNIIAIYLVIVYLSKIIKVLNSSQIYNSIYNKFIKDNFFRDENKNCDKYDPIFLMGERSKKIQLRFVKVKEQGIFVIAIQNSIIIMIFLGLNME